MAIKTPTTKSHGRSVLRIYFLIMTLVAVIGTLVSFGFLLYAVGKKIIITNNEYIVGERYYELDMCSNGISKPTQANQNFMVYPTDKEIAKCKDEKKTTLIEARNATFKTDVLGQSIWTLLFFVLLMIHYPRFMTMNKKD
ncbi:MAG: hypothetical protein WC010_00385 [Candidatus Absconditabacterales bacterium]